MCVALAPPTTVICAETGKINSVAFTFGGKPHITLLYWYDMLHTEGVQYVKAVCNTTVHVDVMREYMV